jgi:hypothetical protein
MNSEFTRDYYNDLFTCNFMFKTEIIKNVTFLHIKNPVHKNAAMLAIGKYY